jgi:predicted permease
VSVLISILSIYFFILLGYLAKKIFQEKIDEKTLIIISIYFLQPILTFWGLTRTPINQELILTPLIYLLCVFTVLIFLILSSRLLFLDTKDQAIFITTSLIGNTGNLGIPLGIALFGESSIAYTSIINIANVFFIYTVGIYFFAKGSYSTKKALKSIAKIPILWVALIALIFNYCSFTIIHPIDKALEMGAYATIVLQLIIFGVYLSKVGFKTIDIKLTLGVSSTKLFILPIVGIFYSIAFTLDSLLASILIMSLCTPLAINNVNNAALFDCKPNIVTSLVFITTILFLVLFYYDLKIIHNIFG